MLGQRSRTSKGKRTEFFLCATAFAAFCIQALVSAEPTNDVPSVKSLDDNPELDNEYSKRGWKTDLPMWGKRGWNNLHSGWGKRDADSDDELNYGYGSTAFDKRAWQRLQGGWGKRFVPSEEDIVIRQMVAALEENDNDNTIDYYPERDFELRQMDKRNWNKFTDGWGKRSNNKWEKFRGSWGKREPAWNNLKGLWGKRSIAAE